MQGTTSFLSALAQVIGNAQYAYQTFIALTDWGRDRVPHHIPTVLREVLHSHIAMTHQMRLQLRSRCLRARSRVRQSCARARPGSSWRQLAIRRSIPGMTPFARPVQRDILAMDQPSKRLVLAAITVWLAARRADTTCSGSASPTARGAGRRITQPRRDRRARRSASSVALEIRSCRRTRENASTNILG